MSLLFHRQKAVFSRQGSSVALFTSKFLTIECTWISGSLILSLCGPLSVWHPLQTGGVYTAMVCWLLGFLLGILINQVLSNEKRVNKQCLLNTPRRVIVYHKNYLSNIISSCKCPTGVHHVGMISNCSIKNNGEKLSKFS